MYRTLLAALLAAPLAWMAPPVTAQTALTPVIVAQATTPPGAATPMTDTLPGLATTDGTYREQPTGLQRWTAMPFLLMLWLLISPLVFAAATQGSPPSSSTARPTLRPDGRPATTVP